MVLDFRDESIAGGNMAVNSVHLFEIFSNCTSDLDTRIAALFTDPESAALKQLQSAIIAPTGTSVDQAWLRWEFYDKVVENIRPFIASFMIKDLAFRSELVAPQLCAELVIAPVQGWRAVPDPVRPWLEFARGCTAA